MALGAVVFDFDGVIVDSEPVHFAALREALLEEGVAITREEYWGIYLAYDDRNAIRLALEHHGQPASRERLDRIEGRKVARFAELIPGIAVFEGARELVCAASAEVPVGIASGARHEEIEAILSDLGLREAFAVIVGSQDVPRTKPDPAPYLEAARLLAVRRPGLQPGDCVAFEDSVPGIVSARGAGMKVVGVAHSLPPEKLGVAHRVVGSLAGLGTGDLRALFG
ncbi:MAG TPA: HAD family phosphatase [Vicinamibacteria bacterium]|nr:HAD family phosphatase [Vicinamibacteria bacterium]